MNSANEAFDEHHTIHLLKHYLPAQAPLKDFVHHNTLHAFQQESFHHALQQASEKFGYKVYQSLNEFRERYRSNKINQQIFDRIITEKKGSENLDIWTQKLLHQDLDESINPRIGQLREYWKIGFKVNLDKEVHPILFRLISAYIDQGISVWTLPISPLGFLESVRNLEKSSSKSLFKSKRARKLLQDSTLEISDLLKILVGNESLFEQYLFDQQFGHPGWSGMISVLEDNPSGLLDTRKVCLRDFIMFELLLEIDVLNSKFGKDWASLSSKLGDFLPKQIMDAHENNEVFEVYALWLEIVEWTYFDQVLKGLEIHQDKSEESKLSYQAIFCIDDRESSLRTYCELEDPNCQTFGSAGFFGIEFYFQPENGKFYTKVCPAPVTPKYLIRESEAIKRHQKDVHFNKHISGVFTGWLTTQTMGFWSGIKLAKSIFKPAETPAMVSSFKHMDPNGKLSYHAIETAKSEDGIQEGFTIDEMATRMESLLRSIGLVKHFAPIVYVMGHGASSVNNTHYAGYDCGACSGRAGSVNARAAAYMLNHEEVRRNLANRGITIPATTQFVGALHDTTRDEAEYFDIQCLNAKNEVNHYRNVKNIDKALERNAKERARRFFLINTKQSSDKVHEQVKLRALSLFEPRPEWNHNSNALCLVGRRSSNLDLFLDQRAFLNSYDYTIDPEGKLLLGILNAVAPVCGGINLEYYFSRVDNSRLGAGSKLPHNVIGLIGVANGMEGDLRPGLPKQMVNIHDPIRLMANVEHYPEVVLNTIKINPATYEWFMNEWVILTVMHPETKKIYRFSKGAFIPYQTVTDSLEHIPDMEKMMESTGEDLPVLIINH